LLLLTLVLKNIEIFVGLLRSISVKAMPCPFYNILYSYEYGRVVPSEP
jgi:hypothetical protein